MDLSLCFYSSYHNTPITIIPQDEPDQWQGLCKIQFTDWEIFRLQRGFIPGMYAWGIFEPWHKKTEIMGLPLMLNIASAESPESFFLIIAVCLIVQNSSILLLHVGDLNVSSYSVSASTAIFACTANWSFMISDWSGCPGTTMRLPDVK